MTAWRRSVLLGLSIVVGGLVVTTTAAAPAWAGDDVCAGIVIQDGGGGSALTQGASVTPGSSDLDLMSAAGDAVTENNSGLVCAINGYPSNGLQDCLEAAHGLFYYWSYWEGDPTTNTWTYANIGPAEHRVVAGQPYVEGWRYQDPGPDSPAAPKPSVSPAAAFAQACPSSNPVPTTSVGRHGKRSPSTTSTSTAPTTASSAPVVGSAPGSTAPISSTSTTVSGRSGVGSAPPPAASDLSTPTSSTTTPPERTNTGDAKLALSSAAEHRDAGGDPALPIVVVVVVIGALCAGAWFRWRRRPREG